MMAIRDSFNAHTVSLFLAVAITLFFPSVIASFYISHKYETAKKQLPIDSSLEEVIVTRAEIEKVLAPLTGSRCPGIPPFDLSVPAQDNVAVFRYYAVHPHLAGCFIYFVFEGPELTDRLIDHTDMCE